MTDAGPELHIGSGAFWFWPQPFWSSFDVSGAPRMGVAGLQVLCDPLTGAPPLPPADLVRAWRAGLAVTVHPTFPGGGFLFDAELDSAFDEIRTWLDDTGVTDVVIHANHFARGATDVAAVKRKLGPAARLLIENVGARAAAGHSIAEMRALLEADADAGAVLDIAHLEELPAPASDLRAWIDDPLLRSRLAMVHVSRSGIASPSLRPASPSPISEADHLPAFLADGPEASIRATLARYPLVLEGCLPPGLEGREWLEREVSYLAAWPRDSNS